MYRLMMENMRQQQDTHLQALEQAKNNEMNRMMQILRIITKI